MGGRGPRPIRRVAQALVDPDELRARMGDNFAREGVDSGLRGAIEDFEASWLGRGVFDD